MNTYGYPQQQYPIGNNRPIYGTTATPVIQNNTTQRIRPVASLEEVRAMNIDFDGSVFYFPDYANRRIYTKQINMDGTASINMYELKEIPNSSQPNNDYITREEFNTTLTSIKEVFAQIMGSNNAVAPSQGTDQPAQQQPAESKPQFNF